MNDFITAARLDPDQVRMAYPIVRSLLPALESGEWERLAARLIGSGTSEDHGIIAARNEAGYFAGLCFYEVERDATGARLVAHHFVAFDVTNRAPVAAALLDAVEKVAGELGCVAIHTCVAASQQNILQRFRHSGYAPQEVVLCKKIAAPGDTATCVEECVGHWPGRDQPRVERNARPR